MDATQIMESERPSASNTPSSGRSITLAINIKIVDKNNSAQDFSTTFTAKSCSQYSDLRAQTVGAISKRTGINTLGKASFRLEEDGKAASMTIAPTTIDDSTPLPALIYEGWYYRIMRGKQSVYKVDVNIKN